MGRGRQKAKQTKVARDLKYSTHAIDVSALQNELSARPGSPPSAVREELDDGYDDYENAYGTGR
ncbi:MAG: DUF3073 domain-containing protein [Nakamurella sp.]